MTDYIPFDPDELAPEAPATALHFSRWANNPIAIAEGAAGAPRVQGVALGGIYAGRVTHTGTGWVGWAGLDGVAEITIVTTANTTFSGQTYRIRFSTDGGATWTGESIIIDAPTVGNGRWVKMDLITGNFVGSSSYVGPLTIPAGVSAIQVRVSSGTIAGVSDLWIEGGVV